MFAELDFEFKILSGVLLSEDPVFESKENRIDRCLSLRKWFRLESGIIHTRIVNMLYLVH